MKKFIRYTSLFALSFLIFILSLNFMVDVLIKDNSYYRINKDRKYLILGHSHPACAYNDSLIDDVKNMANAMEGYFYTYYKLRKLIEANPQIKGVFIDFSNDQFNGFGNERIYGKYILKLVPKYTSVIDMEGLSFLLQKKTRETLQAFNTSIWKKASFCLMGETSFLKEMDWGGYTYITHVNDVNDSTLKKTKDGKKALIEYDQSISETNLIYLRKIVDLCKSKQIKVTIIRTPISYWPIESTNEEMFLCTLRTKFSDVPFLDFNHFKLTKTDLADRDHLNKNGSKKISIFFNQLMKSGMIDGALDQKRVEELMREAQH